ncbi:MAG TPA: hypothetical protein VGI05_24085, partial [Streptosporangiaceae bacterium]
MHARAKVDQPARPLDQAGQQVRGEHVDREDVLEPVIGAEAPRLTVTDPGIVNDRVERAARVGLLGDLPHARDAGQVADDDGLGRGQGRTCVLGPGCTAGMQCDRVS